MSPALVPFYIAFSICLSHVFHMQIGAGKRNDEPNIIHSIDGVQPQHLPKLIAVSTLSSAAGRLFCLLSPL